MFDSEIRRIVEELDEPPKMTQADLDKQKEEFFKRGGRIQQVNTGASAFDFSAKHKPGQTYGKRAY